MSKEFWIEKRTFVQDSHIATEFKYEKNIFGNLPEQIHVIEYSAYEKLQKQNEIMREALEFYADTESWKAPENDTFADAIKMTDVSYLDEENECGGHKARLALAKIEKEEG